MQRINGEITCCGGCGSRSKGCHAVCEKYAAEKAERDKEREERQKYNSAVRDYRYDKKAKIARKLKQHR